MHRRSTTRYTTLPAYRGTPNLFGTVLSLHSVSGNVFRSVFLDRMDVEPVLARKPSVTLRAFKRPLARVSSLVNDKVRRLTKCLATLAAPVRPLVTVNSHVLQQVPVTREQLVAHLALAADVFVVHLHVPRQTGTLGKTLVAFHALVWFFTGVYSQMAPVVRQVTECLVAEMASVWLLSGMSPFVISQRRRCRKAFAADFTLIRSFARVSLDMHCQLVMK